MTYILNKYYFGQLSHVFNEDYINKNVYSTGDSGVSITAANRKNISNIWIGENVIKEEVKRTTLEKHKKACKELFDSIFKEYVTEVEKYSLRIIDKLPDCIMNLSTLDT